MLARSKAWHAAAIQGCQDLRQVVRVHASIRQWGYERDRYLANLLVEMYGKIGEIDSACAVFQSIADKNVFSWTIMAAAFAGNGRFRDAIRCFRGMELHGVRADKHAFTTAVEACTDGALARYGTEIQARIAEAGIESDVFVGTALVNMHGKLQRIDRSAKVFDRIRGKNVVSWTAMIAAFAHNGHYTEALELVKSMDLEGLKPNEITFVVLLEACAGLGDSIRGKDLHSRIEVSSSSIASSEVVVSALIYMYGKCGCPAEAELLFAKMETRNLVSRTAMIAAYAQNGHHTEALVHFRELDLEGIKPDAVSFVSILEACPSLALARNLHARILESGIRLNAIVGTALVHTYRKCGALGLARSTFGSLPRKSLLCWNTMISAYAQHGQATEALKLFNQLKQEGIRPDSITFVSSITACSHVGLVEDAAYNLSSMIRDYRIAPSGEHLGCMVDLLARAGRLEEAEKMAEKIAPDADRVVQCKALLAACKVHSDVKRGARAAKRLLELDPHCDVPYVMLFNLYVDTNEDGDS